MLEQINYRGWQNAYRMANSTVEIVVLADVGPRIIYYGFLDGENIFHEITEQAGLTEGNNFRLYGGHRLWIWPELERTYYPDNSPVTMSRTGESVRFTAPEESSPLGCNLQKEFEIRLDEVGTRVTIMHVITNRGSHTMKLAPWAPSMMRAGGRAILPLPPRAPMDKDHFQSVGPLTLWSFTDLTDPRWIFGTEYIQLRQQVDSKRRFQEQMAGIFNPSGWGAYFLNGTLFIKRASVFAGAEYPDFGCNFEVFTNSEFLELETLGPKIQLEPAQCINHAEQWTLFRGISRGDDDSWIRCAVAPLAFAS